MTGWRNVGGFVDTLDTRYWIVHISDILIFPWFSFRFKPRHQTAIGEIPRELVLSLECFPPIPERGWDDVRCQRWRRRKSRAWFNLSITGRRCWIPSHFSDGFAEPARWWRHPVIVTVSFAVCRGETWGGVQSFQHLWDCGRVDLLQERNCCVLYWSREFSRANETSLRKWRSTWDLNRREKLEKSFASHRQRLATAVLMIITPTVLRIRYR